MMKLARSQQIFENRQVVAHIPSVSFLFLGCLSFDPLGLPGPALGGVLRRLRFIWPRNRKMSCSVIGCWQYGHLNGAVNALPQACDRILRVCGIHRRI
jgi:hypothetical protein